MSSKQGISAEIFPSISRMSQEANCPSSSSIGGVCVYRRKAPCGEMKPIRSAPLSKKISVSFPEASNCGGECPLLSVPTLRPLADRWAVRRRMR